jgi:hypothetical protein
MIGRHQLAEPVEGLLQQGPAGAQDVEELFGPFHFAQRPEPAADATSHDHTVVIRLHKFDGEIAMMIDLTGSLNIVAFS